VTFFGSRGSRGRALSTARFCQPSNPLAKFVEDLGGRVNTASVGINDTARNGGIELRKIDADALVL
jgi:hypothetical protein